MKYIKVKGGRMKKKKETKERERERLVESKIM